MWQAGRYDMPTETTLQLRLQLHSYNYENIPFNRYCYGNRRELGYGSRIKP